MNFYNLPANLDFIYKKINKRETRLELATSSLARKHSTTELLPLIGLEVFFMYLF